MERHGEDDEQMEKGKVYALCPLDSLRERVHVVQPNPLLQLLHYSASYKNTLREVMKSNADRQSEFFYVNRFVGNDDISNEER